MSAVLNDVVRNNGFNHTIKLPQEFESSIAAAQIRVEYFSPSDPTVTLRKANANVTGGGTSQIQPDLTTGVFIVVKIAPGDFDRFVNDSEISYEVEYTITSTTPDQKFTVIPRSYGKIHFLEPAIAWTNITDGGYTP